MGMKLAGFKLGDSITAFLAQPLTLDILFVFCALSQQQ